MFLVCMGGMECRVKNRTPFTVQNKYVSEGIPDDSPLKRQVSIFNIYTQHLSQKPRRWITHDLPLCLLSCSIAFLNLHLKVLTHSSWSVLIQHSPPSPEPQPLPVINVTEEHSTSPITHHLYTVKVRCSSPISQKFP